MQRRGRSICEAKQSRAPSDSTAGSANKTRLGVMMKRLRPLGLTLATLAHAAALLARPGPQLTSPPPVPPRRSPALTMLSPVDSGSWCERVEGCDGLAVVFFYAPWCRNCKAVRPALERVERRFARAAAEGGAPAEASFFEVDFRAQTKLCYEQRVFQFPTVHFYLPGLGRVGRCALTAKQAEPRLRATLSRLLESRQQLQRVSEAALAPLVRYSELASALRGVAAAASAPAPAEPSDTLQPKRLRSMVVRVRVRVRVRVS